MKRADKTMDTKTGKLIARTTPLGTVTEEMVLKRAKEIAVTNGRDGNAYNQNDYEEARRELTGLPNPEDAKIKSVPDTGAWLGASGDRGAKAPVRPAKDEQTFAEELVQEGVEEATHHQMLVGNQSSRDRDKL